MRIACALLRTKRDQYVVNIRKQKNYQTIAKKRFKLGDDSNNTVDIVPERQTSVASS